MDEAVVHCAICAKDITQLEVDSRNSHVERCLDGGDGSTPQPAIAENADQLPDAEMLTRLADCPICGAEWIRLHCTRPTHVEECAKRHRLSKDELRSLLSLFRESLTTISSGRKPKVKGAGTAFVNAFNTPKISSPTSAMTVTKKTRTHPKLAAKSKTIDRWFGKQPSAETKDTERAYISNCRRADSSRSAALEFEIESDDEFQSTKVRIPLRQTCISLTRPQNKRRQEFLDELDDDLQEAKVMSLSLMRSPKSAVNPVNNPKNGSTKRRGGGGGGVDNVLAVSEILASKEAQDYLRHRAAALAHMDECARQFKISAKHSPPPTADPGSARDSCLVLKLWHLGSLSEPADREYCPMFEKYKLDHQPA